MQLTRRISLTCLALYLVSQALFLINIQFPKTYNFDEFHYVPSAKQFLEMKHNQNQEHPPLAKLLMAGGIAIWGDQPLGWRFMSTLFGAFTLVGMYLWGLALFRNEATALWVALLTLVNQIFYVQSRIGMLDTFMFAFLVWSLAAFTAAWDDRLNVRQVRTYWVSCGIFMGLSLACKWFTLIPWAVCLGLVVAIRIFQTWGLVFQKPHSDDWYQIGLWRGMKPMEWILWLFIIPIVTYAFTFIPLFMSEGKAFTPSAFLDAQKGMWDLQQRVLTSHPYMSNWTSWPLMKRPIWYAFEKEGANGEWVRGVLCLGNPLIMWSGILAVVAVLWGWLIQRNRDAFLIFVFYSAFFWSWAVIPRKIAFYYYYYPAAMVLSMALGYVFHHGEHGKYFRYPWARWTFMAASLVVFIYFFPILAALKIPMDSFRHWMWFRTWI